MKVKNLLLAGLAVAAMTACSNNDIDEIVDNGTQPTTCEKASMKINFTFADSGTGTRTVTAGGTDAGEEFEWKAADITVVLNYDRGDKRIVTKNLKLEKEPADNGKVAQYSTEQFEVDGSAGGTDIYAFVNPSDALIASLSTADLATLAVNKIASLPATLDYLTGTGLAAESNSFLMTGTAMNQKLTYGEVVTVPITVSRVVAKLDEMTEATKAYPISETSELTNKDAITIKITEHSYSNLSDDSYALKASTSITSSYLQPYIAQNNTASYDSYKWIAAGNTYCYENFGNETPTRVHYVGEVLFDGEAITTDFYVWARFEGAAKVVTAYKNWETLTAAVSIPEEFKTNDQVLKEAYGVKRYKSGRCYYEAEILHATEGASIIRNNWYKLSVRTISDLGTPDPVKEPEDKKTYLIINANVEPWTVNINDFDL